MPKPDDTPLMQQWREAKARHPDALIFFRVGDFYEMFNEDAEEGARLLGLTLTARNNGGAAGVPLAGVPAKARDEYVQRLVRLGRRVAICDQVEDPAQARGIVRREVTETVTPGAILSGALLADRRNNFLVAVAWGDAGPTALAAADISTGELLASPVDAMRLASELARLEPAELLLPRSVAEVLSALEPDGARAATDAEGGGASGGAGAAATDRAMAAARQAVLAAPVTSRADWLFDPELAGDELKRRFRVRTLDGFGFQSSDAPLVGALGALVAYLAEVQPPAVEHLRPPRIERPGDAMALDEMTRRNLELVEPLRPDLAGRADGGAGTLLDVVDQTLTAMGARLLRRWLLRPLVVAERIWRRQEAVAVLREDPGLRRRLRRELGEIRDLERLAARVGAGRSAPRELAALRASLQVLPELVTVLAEESVGGATLLHELRDEVDPLEDVRALLERALAEEPPATLGDGGVVRRGYDAGLDEVRDVRDGARDFIARLQKRERERSGIASLKVGYNKVFGYYLEVTKANLERVPEDYERRQTLANAERYITPELKEWESKVLNAEERILELEARLFGEVRGQVAQQVDRLLGTAAAVAALDVLAGFAELAERQDYVRPAVHTGYGIEIRAGRHPVVETMMPREDFIPNDVVLDEDARIMILTGPNMAGKSTLLRQVGLIQLLAQVGAFVPASHASVPVCDRIFTRVGASDNLVRGQSTFMVEMHETAAILHGASRASLVLLDEIGRGTATYDGVSIAWAVTEYLHETLGAKTIFATHYHELTQLGDLLPGVVNANVSVREVGAEIVFLRRLEPGGADRSYGIEVGRLAGLPAGVTDRAREILRELEGSHSAGGAGLGRRGRNAPRTAPPTDQLSFFAPATHPVVERLRELDPERLTPLEALNLLARLKAEADGAGEQGGPQSPG